MAAFIETLTKMVDGIKSTIYPKTTTAAVLDFTGENVRTQTEINQSLQTQVSKAMEQYNHVTKEWYDAADANTLKYGSSWSPINPAAPSLMFDAIYVIDDATYDSSLRAVIEEMFVEIDEADYEAMRAAGTLNPYVWYFIVYPENS